MNIHGKSRFSHNFLATFATFAAHTLLGMWYIRMLVVRIGPERYGIIPLVTSVMGYLGIATLAFNASTGRHMMVGLTGGDRKEVSRIAGTALTGIVLLLIPVLALGLVVLGLLPDLIRIPAGAELDTRLFFACTLLGFLLTQISIPYATATFCTNRLDWRAGVDLSVYVLRTVGAYLLLVAFGNRLWPVGLAIAVAGGFQWLAKWALWKRLLPDVACQLGCFDRTIFRRILATGTWVTVNAGGALMFLATDLIIINRLAGPREAGLYAPVLTLSQVVRSIAGSLGNLFAPKITRLYAEGDRAPLQRYVVDATKFMGILIGIPIGVLCALSRDFLVLWMGPLYGDRWPLVWLLLGHLCINLSVYPLQAVQTAWVRMRIPAWVTLGMGVGHVGLAILLARALGHGQLGGCTLGRNGVDR
jgi:membrane protein EpsK